MRSWSMGILLVLAVALAGAGGAGLVLWLQGRKAPVPQPVPQVAPPAPEVPLPQAPVAISARPDAAPGVEEVIAKAMPAVVLVETSSGRGSAFFVDRDRLLTNHHVVAGQSYVKLRLSDNRTLDAGIAATAQDYDLAVLRIMGPAPDHASLALGTIQEVRQGQEVLAIGTPLGVFQNTVTRGIVSGLRQLDKVVVLQTDTSLNPGNSGGPLIDHAGRVVGINTMGFRGSQGLNFAVAIDHARALMEGKPLPIAFVTPPADGALKGLLPGASASEADQAREEGAKRYATQLVALARSADQLESSFATFLAYYWDGKVVGSFDRNFYALWERGALQGTPVKGHESEAARMRAAADQFRERSRGVEDLARKADVFPGTRRDLRQRLRLDHKELE
ncbi:MAG: trypsin-like peptidase domain-containing protein [Acidobacteria bacterium]|nr:trypsin-like peptidase domain-containing protein [Acidobacteriota bacterium]MBI3490132.1 trypsin-like peptidase domain-containing protein [Acidobacteriota bacterium]